MKRVCTECNEVFEGTAWERKCGQCKTKTCERCGKKFKTRNGKLAAKQRFCSKKCYDNRSGRVVKICIECGEEFPGKTTSKKCNKCKIKICEHCKKGFIPRADDQKFCSKMCYNGSAQKRKRICTKCGGKFEGTAWSKKCKKCKTLTCENCGQEFYRRTGTGGNQRFCSRQCFYSFDRTGWSKTQPSPTGAYKFGIERLGRELDLCEVELNRREDCCYYDGCLDLACSEKWQSFSCLKCKKFTLGKRSPVYITAENRTVMP